MEFLIGLKNKNTELDIKGNVERSERRRSKPKLPLPHYLPSRKESEFLFLPDYVLSMPNHLTSCLSVQTS